MNGSITIQDIADALQMSRNTVSKALNGKPVPAKTRSAVISMAIEMGYKGYKMAAASEKKLGQKKILLISSRLLLNINYYIYVLKGLEESLDGYDIELTQFNITNHSSFNKLKRYLSANDADGILCIEFFDPDYIEDLLTLDRPLIFLDFPVVNKVFKGKYDIILPESQDAVKNFCLKMITEKHCRTFGFVGDHKHCRSFYERFSGMRDALFLSELPFDLSYSILKDDSSSYDAAELIKNLKELANLPDCFVAANDSIAISLIEALKDMGINIPDEIKVVGFDNISAAKNTEPPLSTFNVNKGDLGKIIANIILERISDPMQANQIIHIFSKMIIRSTT